MKKITDTEKVRHLICSIDAPTVYPLSIAEGFQSGEIYADDTDNPKAALFWHRCGFAFAGGILSDDFLSDIISMMKHPSEEHRNRLIIHSFNSSLFVFSDEIEKKERQIFSHSGEMQHFSVPEGTELCPVTGDNYHLISGRIAPPFSWESKEEFLKNGFGFCLMKNGSVLSCAFSSAVSNKEIDIGVETNEQFRGRGYGIITSSAMVNEILKMGKVPSWQCDAHNEGSKRLAYRTGFRDGGIHSVYKLKEQ